MRPRSLVFTLAAAAAISVPLLHASLDAKPRGTTSDGQFVFRFDTFGNEDFWTDMLRLHEVIQSSVSPRTALAVGLKVDAGALPPNFLARANLDDPATTVELLRRNAVVGVQAEVEDKRITRIGITCALCHSVCA